MSNALKDAEETVRALSAAVEGLRKQADEAETAISRGTFMIIVSSHEGIVSSPEFEEIGGIHSVRQAVRMLYDKVMNDPDLAFYFEGSDLYTIQTRQVEMFLAILGVRDYEGLDIGLAHSHLNITAGDFSKLLEHLRCTLHEMKLPEPVITKFMSRFISFEPNIVGSHD